MQVRQFHNNKDFFKKLPSLRISGFTPDTTLNVKKERNVSHNLWFHNDTVECGNLLK